jgi:predicted DNA-binding antitoxin AbrB/MazE fold protein
MIHECDAVYRGGVFVPQEPCGLSEETRVHLIVHQADIQPPQTADPVERARGMREMIERWRNTPVAPEAFPLMREALHERR